MNRIAAALAALAVCSLLAGCPESVHPASDPAQATPDPGLHGVWHGSFEGDEVYVHVGPGERGMTEATVVTHQKKGALKTERYLAFPTRLGKLDLLNVRQIDANGDLRGYVLFRYQASARKLTLWMLSYSAAREDIKAGKLKGKAEEGPYGDTLITASSPELAAYLQEGEQARLFDKPLVFRRE